MKIIRRIAKITAITLLLLVVVIAALFGAVQTDAGRNLLAETIGDAVSGPDFGLEVRGIDGFVPFDMTVAEIRIRDGAGPWLAIENAHLAWDPGALLREELAVTALGAARVTVSRPPQPTDAPEPEPPAPIGLPVLPVAIDLEALQIDRIILEAPVIGTPVAATLSAGARLGHPGEGLDLTVDLRRVDSVPAQLTLDAHYRPEDQTLTVDGTVREPPGGLFAALLQRPDLPDVVAELSGTGPLDDWSGRLTASVGDLADLAVVGRIEAVGEGRRLSVDLAGDVAAFLPPPAPSIVGDELGVSADVPGRWTPQSAR